ncbi:MAG: coagulation factor 5/8 type domain-containing protein, partial [Candidatus Eisenbacteria bacterium]
MPRAASPASIAAGLLLAWGAVARPSPAAGPVLVDDFEDVSRWSAHPADGVEMKLSDDGAPGARSLRIDFRFARGGGYAVARRAVDLTLPDNYAFSFRMRGEAPSNNIEFKLIDSTGENVWWCNRRNVEFPRRWETFAIKRRQIEFAWGPAGGGTISRVAAIEIAITAGSGGQGTVWLDQLELRTLAPPRDDVAPVARASSSR